MLLDKAVVTTTTPTSIRRRNIAVDWQSNRTCSHRLTDTHACTTLPRVAPESSAAWSQTRARPADRKSNALTNHYANEPHRDGGGANVEVMLWLQLRFDFDSTGVQLLIEGH